MAFVVFFVFLRDLFFWFFLFYFFFFFFFFFSKMAFRLAYVEMERKGVKRGIGLKEKGDEGMKV